MADMIELTNVSKSFGSRVILDNVSFTIKKGETFVIIGQSGTGKTVTLRHIAGLFDPDRGDVFVNGEKMNGIPVKKKKELRKYMGFLFQSGALLNWLTVGGNVALPLIENRLCPPEKIDEIVDQTLERLMLTDAKNMMISEISGGMKKRAGLARTLVTNPEIILYDEPTSGLDPVMSSLINDLIKKLQKDLKVTSVVVTHDMKSAYAIADKIAMLYNGRIIQLGDPDEIRNTQNPVVRQFIDGLSEGPITEERKL
jgi:phospholipid/cholesterol/gamma-HCH transport system ATP-binding protein